MLKSLRVNISKSQSQPFPQPDQPNTNPPQPCNQPHQHHLSTTTQTTTRKMSAPHIPNLLSRGNSGPRSRGRGQGRSTRGGPSSSGSAIRDQTVQSTDTDAAVSRLSAVSMGYLDDEYAQYFVKLGAGTRRLPIINRGIYLFSLSFSGAHH